MPQTGFKSVLYVTCSPSDKDHETQKYCQDYLYTEHKTPEELLPSAIDQTGHLS